MWCSFVLLKNVCDLQMQQGAKCLPFLASALRQCQSHSHLKWKTFKGLLALFHFWRSIWQLFFVSHSLPSMTSYRAIGKTIKTIKVSLSFPSASFTFNGNVFNLGSEVVRPSARVTERMPSIGCVLTPCCWTKLAEMKSWDDPESIRKTASWPSIFPRNLRSSSKWLDRWALLIS